MMRRMDGAGCGRASRMHLVAHGARARTSREGELEQQEIGDDRREAAQVAEAAHGGSITTPTTRQDVRYFTSNCAVMPCTLCGLPSFASGRKQTMP